MLHHIQPAMPQQRLKGENIAARTQIGDGKGMPETMGMAFLHTDLFTQRAALVRQRAGLFGVVAVLGLVLAIIAPFMETGLI